MLTRLLFAATLAGVFALPAVAGAHHGGSGIVGATRVGDLKIDVSTEADVRAFAGTPDRVDDGAPYPWIRRLGYHCRARYDCRTEYEINRGNDTLFGFVTNSRRFRTRRGTRVGDTRRRAERKERRRADHKICGDGTRSLVRERNYHTLYILFDRRRVFAFIVDSTLVDC